MEASTYKRKIKILNQNLLFGGLSWALCIDSFLFQVFQYILEGALKNLISRREKSLHLAFTVFNFLFQCWYFLYCFVCSPGCPQWQITHCPNSFIFMQLLGKNWPNNKLASYHWGWRPPPSGESWIRHWSLHTMSSNNNILNYSSFFL